MRRILAVGSLALALLATTFTGAAHAAPSGATRAQANIKPVFNNYLVCFNGWVYTDFTDPDGDDTLLQTWVLIFLRDGSIRWVQMGNSGGAGHGVFFYLQLSSIGVNPANVTEYWFNAKDYPWGAWSGYTRANPSCQLLP